METAIENDYGDANIAQLYATYRPYYPQEVFDKIMDDHNDSKHCAHQLAVDVCCGSGRGTVPLTKYFTKVIGVDSSSDQLKHVSNNCPNLETRLGSAEDLSMFGPNEVDLLSIAMGLHYVDVLRYDDIKMSAEMTLDQYAGWLRSVHVTHLYDNDNVGEEPCVEQARKRLKATLGEERDIRLKTSWSVFMILGRK